MSEDGAMTQDDGRGSRNGPASLILPGVLAALAFAILVGLGTWQLHRLEWKEGLIARVEARVDEAPVPAPGPATWADFDLSDWQYRPVRLEGRFGEGELHAWIALTRPRGPLGGPGYFVIAPFRTGEGWYVLVNRGFVPEAAKDPADRPGSAPPEGPVEVVGLVRESETPSFVTPEPDVAANVWFAREAAAMSEALGLPPGETAPYFVDAAAARTPPGGLPQAGETRLSFPNNHLQYALTWYGLAATCLVVFVLFARRRLSRAPEPSAEPEPPER